ncbi:MAG: hypothetical protein Q8J62_07140 [Candidatus Cloacimonadaceae bacterium]|nr:hypothetical protein [Candidatus Cloacimonadaceae bacterium]
MGTQQILLIVLSVIIVGVAIAVGITMFNNNAYNQSRSAVAAELSSYASQAVQWYKTPVAQGGRGDVALVSGQQGTVAAFIGFTGGSLSTESGTYQVTTTGDNVVTMHGLGKHAKGTNFALGTTVINFPAGIIVTTMGEYAALPTIGG